MYQHLTIELQPIKDDDGPRYKESLSWLDAIDPSQNVDSICAEYSQHPHIHIIQNAWNTIY